MKKWRESLVVLLVLQLIFGSYINNFDTVIAEEPQINQEILIESEQKYELNSEVDTIEGDEPQEENAAYYGMIEVLEDMDIWLEEELIGEVKQGTFLEGFKVSNKFYFAMNNSAQAYLYIDSDIEGQVIYVDNHINKEEIETKPNLITSETKEFSIQSPLSLYSIDNAKVEESILLFSGTILITPDDNYYLTTIGEITYKITEINNGVLSEEVKAVVNTESPLEKSKEDNNKSNLERVEGHNEDQIDSLKIMGGNEVRVIEQFQNVFQVDIDAHFYLRDNATSELRVAGTLRKGEVFPRVRDYGSWHEIQFGDQRAYVRKNNTSPLANATIPNLNKGRVSNDRLLTLRQDVPVYDNSTGTLIPFASLIKGTKVKAIREYGTWYEIDVSGRIGYIHQSATSVAFSNKDQYFQVIDRNLVLYQSKSGVLTPIGELVRGQIYPRIRNYGKWHEVRYGNDTAYVWQESTVPRNNASLKSENLSFLSKDRILETSRNIPVYDNTSGSLIPFATLYKGSQIRSISKYGSWYRIDLSGRVGYVNQNHVEVSFEDSDQFFQVTRGTVPIYLNKSGTLVQSGELLAGEIYPRIRSYGSWHEIQFGDKRAYVWQGSTKPIKDGRDITNLNTISSSSGKSVKITHKTNVVDNSRTGLIPFAVLNEGTQLKVISDYGSWYRIDISGRIGFIRKTVTEELHDKSQLNSRAFINKFTTRPFESSFKRTDLTGATAIRIGNLILDNYIYSLSHWEPYKYEVLDWHMDPYNDNSWQLYFHSLRMVSFLVNAYEETKEDVYLLKAIEITESWIRSNPNHRSTNNWAWSDHAVSSRILTWAYLYENLQKSNVRNERFNQLLLSSLYEHAEWQVKESNYRFPHNHGIMQDRSLIEASWLFESFSTSDHWFELSLSRLNKQLEHSISKSGVHLEHSPGYHIYTLNLFQDIEAALNKRNQSVGHNLEANLNKMEEYLAYVFKPDGTLPLVGDTEYYPVERISHLNHPYLEYILSKGKSGEMPSEPSKVYKDAGVAILRDEWKSGDKFDQSSYLMLQAGYHSNVHKHADDLSFVLYSMGEDIFVGPGKYMYANNPMRNYMLSGLSHNTVTIDGKGYDLNLNKTGAFIKEYELTEEYDRVVAEHTLYDGVNFTREIIFIKPNIFVIIDSLASKKVHNFEQRFNLNPNAEILNYSKTGLRFSLNKDLTVELKQLNSVDKVNYYRGGNNPIRGYISYKTNELTEVDQFEFIKRGSSTQFVTLVKLDSARYENKAEDVTIENSLNHRKITYTVNGVSKSLLIPN
ncbi:alginate lyase family protein [Alkalihalophilus marmarensis]|uniref:alginate lyase family protein n=1 Tax=Alkalihalophilus marmarensis TaxID=521377 RepID=UPI002E251525|nr:alginate lyase family protein [Alkalihalophilus marmarensis]